MRTLLGVILISLSLCLLLVEFYLLETAERAAAGARGMRPDWWQHVGLFLLALAVGWLGFRIARGGFAGRLVRGRGLTPAAEDE